MHIQAKIMKTWGYELSFWDILEINECENSPCIHGNCSDHLNNYTCDCEAGYNGSNCQTGEYILTPLFELFLYMSVQITLVHQ